MGSGRFDARAYATYSSSTVGKSTEQIYKARECDPYLNPLGVHLRESRDSADNPNSTPIIVALDVTGSMGMLADQIARSGLGTLFNGILERKPVPDPHIMFMGIGDANCDRAPLQVSQFEADIRIVEQLEKLWLEKGGGGNNFESYNLPWYFAAFHTEHDSMVKRGKRGYLFTVGDEMTPAPLAKAQIKAICGDDIEADLTTKDLLELAQRKYNCFHIVIQEGSYARSNPAGVEDSWRGLMGQNVIMLSDHKLLPQTIVSAIEVAEGRDAKTSAEGWGLGSGAVHAAVKNLPRSAPMKRLGAS